MQHGRRITKSRLPTNMTANSHPIHRWYNFIAGFSPEFVQSCIRDARLTTRQVLIDPFAGLATALVQANLERIPSIGFEPHPFFFDISQAKLTPPTTRHPVDAIESRLVGLAPYQGPLRDVWSSSGTVFLRKLVPERDLRCLAQAVLLEEKVAASRQALYRLIGSRVLELTSVAMTDGVYKAPTTKKMAVPYHEAVGRICTDIRQDIEVLDGTIPQQATLFPTTSERMLRVASESCSLCVTSPPYLNNFDFAEMARMELYFWRYAGSWGEITERVRRNLIVNTTAAPTDVKKDHQRFRETLSRQMQATLEPVVEALAAARTGRRGSKDYYRLVYPYFSQMHSVLQELRRVLRIKSLCHVVVADSALYGVHIETHNLLAALMEESGFAVLRIEQLRTRGERWVLAKRTGAKKGLGEYHIVARRI